jgi:membrane protease YdiL (CAAX protease family)
MRPTARLDRPFHWRRRSPGWSDTALRVSGGYVLLAVLATALSVALRDGLPWVHPEPWLPAPPAVSMVSSAVLGLAAATAIIAFTRVTVRRFGWAQRLHSELRPVARELTVGQILVLAGLSSLGEELLFRGLLVPVLGVALSAALFGLAHQIKGPSRWVWAGWATAVGLMLGAVFALTGSLVGPLLAHAIVNAANLTYLRDHDPAY